MPKLQMTRDKHLIFIHREDLNKTIRYNLKSKQMEKEDKDGFWHAVSTQYDFFKYCSINDIETSEEKFRKLLEKTIRINSTCKSLSTFFARLNEALVYENYIAEGIETECRVRYNQKRVLTQPLEFYSRNTINFFKDNDIHVTLRIEKEFTNNKILCETFVNVLNDSDLQKNDKKILFEEFINQIDHFRELIITHNYEILPLCRYLAEYLKQFEGISISEGVRTLLDYYTIAHQIGRDVKKYPKYLKSMHDIMRVNHQAFKKEYDELLFSRIKKPQLEFQGTKFCIVVPQTTRDIISEGVSLNHCVGSYIERILQNDIYVFFMRENVSKEKSLVTLELKENKIIQAKGSYNRVLTEEEKKFLERFSREKQLEMTI